MNIEHTSKYNIKQIFVEYEKKVIYLSERVGS